jgi:hypothetical protein
MVKPRSDPDICDPAKSRCEKAGISMVILAEWNMHDMMSSVP